MFTVLFTPPTYPLHNVVVELRHFTSSVVFRVVPGRDTEPCGDADRLRSVAPRCVWSDYCENCAQNVLRNAPKILVLFRSHALPFTERLDR